MNDALDYELRQEGLFVNDNSKYFLRSITRWTKFFYILGIIIIAIMVLGTLFAGTLMSHLTGQATGVPLFGGITLVIMNVIFIGLYVYPTYNLYIFSTKCKKSLSDNDSIQLAESLQSLRNTFAFIGIITGIMLVLYFVILFIGLVGGLAALGAN